jgi:hypothetical protein
MLPPEARLPEARALIDEGLYFVVHAPRQTGKTTTLIAMANSLTAEGRHVALLVSCGRAAAAGDDYGAAEAQILAAIREEAIGKDLPAELQPPDPWPAGPSGVRLHRALSRWAMRCPLPIVLLLDEIDALRGASLISVLQQLRDGFPTRPSRFPMSVVLCGLRDVRESLASEPARSPSQGPRAVGPIPGPARTRDRHDRGLRSPPRCSTNRGTHLLH